MRIAPHIVDDDNTTSVCSGSPGSPHLDKSLVVISRPPLEIHPDERASPIISSTSSPITTVIKPTPENGNQEDMPLQTQMKRFFEGDDSWEDVDAVDVYKAGHFGFTSIEVH